MIGIIAIYRPNLVVNETKLQHMRCAVFRIERNRIVHNGFDVLRSLTGTQISLNDV